MNMKLAPERLCLQIYLEMWQNAKSPDIIKLLWFLKFLYLYVCECCVIQVYNIRF